MVVFDLQSQGEVFGCFVFRISMYFFCLLFSVGWVVFLVRVLCFVLVFPVTYVHVAIVNGKLDGK